MASTANPTRDDFAAMLDESLGGSADGGFEGRVVKGTITAIENDKAVIEAAVGAAAKRFIEHRGEIVAGGVGERCHVVQVSCTDVAGRAVGSAGLSSARRTIAKRGPKRAAVPAGPDAVAGVPRANAR